MLHPVLKSVSRAFNEAGISWCLLRVPANLDKPDGGDVDLLVGARDIEAVRKTLRRLGFLARGRGSHALFVTYHTPTDCWLWLDVATELSFGSAYALRTHCEAGLLSRRQRDGEVFMPSADDAFWSLVLHCLLDKKNIALRHRARLEELVGLALTNGPLARVVGAVSPDGWSPERIVETVSRRDWMTLERLAVSLTESKTLWRSVNPIHLAVHRALRVIRRLLNPWHHPGVSVGLLGPDGAGKSTLATSIQNSFIFPVRSIYMGLTGGFLVHADKLRIPLLVIPGRLCVLWSRYIRAQYHQLRGRLVIFDRYIYDGLVPPPEQLNWLKQLSRWLDSHACPAPDLVLMLDAPGDVMYQRKGQRKHKPEELESARQQFLALQPRIPQFQIVDATRTRDQVRADVVARIWQLYVVR